MYHYQRLDNRTSLPYLPLTDPALRVLLTQLDQATTIAMGAMFWGQPAGIALANYDSSTQQAELQELFVTPACREAGMGTTLLATLEAAVAEQGGQKIQVLYQTDEYTPYLERLLQKQGWGEPKLQNYLFWMDGYTGDIPWIDRSRLPSAYQLFPWAELTPAECEAIETRQAAEAWYPAVLSPFLVPEEALCSLNSLGLRYQGQVVGWMLTRLEDKEIICYETLFVSPELQPLGTGIRLLAAAIQRQLARGGLQKTLWRVAPDNQPMLRFVQHGFGPWLTHQAEERFSFKIL